MTRWCSKPVTCWETPLLVSEMLYGILPTAALCGTNQEHKFQILDYTQRKSSSVWEVLGQTCSSHTSVSAHQMWQAGQGRVAACRAGSDILRKRHTVQIAGPELSITDSNFRGTQFYWGKMSGASKGADDLSLLSSFPHVSLAHIKITGNRVNSSSPWGRSSFTKRRWWPVKSS